MKIARFCMMLAATLICGYSFGSEDSLIRLLKLELNKKYPEARIEVLGGLHWLQGSPPAEVKSISILAENARGEVRFRVYGNETHFVSEAWAVYAAWASIPIANRRISPGEKLDWGLFNTQEINISTGMAYEYRGVMLSRNEDLTHLEAKNTILEGQFALLTHVQRIPDVRRGDSIQVHLLSNSLILSTVGIAEEPAYINGSVRVLTPKTKKELVGKLASGGVVEVKL